MFFAGVAVGLSLAGFAWYVDWVNRQFDPQEQM